MWDEIADMPGEIFDLTEVEMQEAAAAWEDEQMENETPGWGPMGWEE